MADNRIISQLEAEQQREVYRIKAGVAGMSAEIIDLKAKHRSRNPGFVAREVLIEIVSDLPFMVDQRVAAAWAEQVLMELRIRKFKIVPIESGDE